VDRRRRDPSALAVERVAIAQTDEDPAPSFGMRDGEVAVLGLGLARLQQGAQRLVAGTAGGARGRFVRDPLALEDPDGDRVRAGRERRLRRGGDAHGASTLRD
jgi:hypothetical protein